MKPGGLFGAALSGTPNAFGTGLNLGMGTPQATAPTLSFSATTAPASGLSFGMTTSTPMPGFATSTARPPGTLSFGTPAATTAPQTAAPSLSFGAQNTPTTGFNLPVAQPQPTSTAAPGLAFGAVATSTPAATGFNLGGTTATPAPTTAPTGLSFGLTPGVAAAPQLATTSAGLTLGSVAPAAAPGFSQTATTSAPGLALTFALGSTAPAVNLNLGSFSLPGTTSAPSTAFNLGSAAPTISAGFSMNKTSATTATTAAASTAPQTSLGTITTVSASSSGQTGALNFCQLEESINKWTLELEEQEKAFMNQATQVNAWDKLLIANGEKIVTLNQEVERVKLEQQQLEHELDYVVGQQKELQDCLVPLEKELGSLSVSDPEREYTYRLAEKLDTQLKQMSEDLKEIIEHLNEANRAQDSSDPIVQIGKILNAHMNSLQWIDQRTSILGQKIQQIDQMHQNYRQENERSFSLAYN